MMEILVVMLILMLTTTMWSMSRRHQLRVAYLAESEVLRKDIINKENIVFAAIGTYAAVALTGVGNIGGIEMVNASQNSYFRTFLVNGITNTGFLVTMYGAANSPAAGITVTYDYDRNEG